MNTEIRDLMQQYINLKNEEKALAKKIDDTKKAIIAEHKRQEFDILVADGFISKFDHRTRTNLLKEPIERLLGGVIPEECKSYTTYDVLAVDFNSEKAAKLLTESKAKEL